MAGTNTSRLNSIRQAVLNYLEPSAYAEQISPNFRREEFNDEGLPIDQVMVDPRLVQKLEEVRSAAGNRKLHITSGYRSPAYNATIPDAAKDSQHPYGRASDFHVEMDDNTRMPVSQLNAYAKAAGMWTKTYPNRIHADVGQNPRPDLSPVQNIPMYSYVLKINKDKNFVDRLYNPDKYPVINNPDGSVSTMKMMSADNIAFPKIIYDKQTKTLKELSPREAYNHAISTGEYIKLHDAVEAADFAANGYKKAFAANYFNQPNPRVKALKGR